MTQDISQYMKYFDGIYTFPAWHREIFRAAVYRSVKGDSNAVLVDVRSGAANIVACDINAFSRKQFVELSWVSDPKTVPDGYGCIMNPSTMGDDRQNVKSHILCREVAAQIETWGSGGELVFVAPTGWGDVGPPGAVQVVQNQDSGKFENVDFQHAWIFNLDWSNFQFTGCKMNLATIKNTCFQNATFEGVLFSGNTISDCDFSWGSFKGANAFASTTFSRCGFASRTFDTGDFTAATFSDCRFDSASLTGVTFKGTKFVNCHFEGVQFGAGNDFTQATFTGCTFTSLDIFSQPGVGTVFHGCIFAECSFSGRKFDGYDFSNCNFSGVPFAMASLKNVNFSGANLSGCDFTGACIDRANLAGADLSNANLLQVQLPATSADAAKLSTSTDALTKFCSAKVSKKLFPASGDPYSYAWTYCDLTGTSFLDDSGAPDTNLNSIDFSYSILSTSDAPANWTRVNLSFSKLNNAKLESINLSHAVLFDTTLEGANILHAEMPYVLLYGMSASLAGATVVGVNFANAYLAEADFSNIGNKDMAGCIFTGACLVNARFQETDLSQQDGDKNVSFDSACLQGADFTNANLSRVSLNNAAISETSGTLTIKGVHNVQSLNFNATLIVKTETDSSTICPCGSRGPCDKKTDWEAPKSPMSTWQYGD